MKKLIILFALLVVTITTYAQSDYSYSITTVGDCKGHFWDYTDTLVDGKTIDALIRVKSKSVLDIQFQVVFNELTGAATATLSWLGSNDGVTYVAIDAASAVTADGSVWANLDDFNYSYLKLLMTVSGTQTSTMKCYYSIRQE